MRDGYRCVRCGKAGVLEVHHVKPLADGGAPYSLRNLETLCRGCHGLTHHPVPPDVAEWKQLLLECS